MSTIRSHSLISRAVLVAFVGAAASLASGIAAATDARQRVVSYSDLNLASEADAAALYERLERAARVVCGQRDQRDLRTTLAVRECEAQALSEAVAAVDSAMVTAMHESSARFAVARE